MPTITKSALLGLLLLAVATAFAQRTHRSPEGRQDWEPRYQNPNFKIITEKDGLSSNQIRDIIEDKEGFIWIATLNGLNRYDGIGFERFKRSGDTTSVQGITFNLLRLDNEEDLWATYENGICRFDYETEQFEHFEFTDHFTYVHGLEVRNDTAWLATEYGLARLEAQTGVWTWFHYLSPDEPDQFSTLVQNLDKNELWLGRSGNQRMVCFNTTTKQFSTVADSLEVLRPVWMEGDSIWCRLWGEGIGVYNLETKKWTRKLPSISGTKGAYRSFVPRDDSTFWITDVYKGPGILNKFTMEERFFTSDETLPNAIIESIFNKAYKDKSGNVWFCSRRGLLQYAPKLNRFKVRKIFPESTDRSESLPFRVEDCHYLKGTSKLAVGINDLGIRIYDTLDWSYVHLQNPPYYDKTSHYGYFQIRETPIGLVGNFGWYLSRIGEDEIKPINEGKLATTRIEGHCLAFDVDREGSFWMGCQRHANYRYFIEQDSMVKFQFGQNGYPKMYYNIGVLVDSRNQLWMSNSRGLFRQDMETREMIRYQIPGIREGDTALLAVNHLLEGPNGKIWASSTEYGLYLIDPDPDAYPESRILESANALYGLPDEPIHAIVFDSLGFLWLASGERLLRLNPTNGHIRSFSEKDGFYGEVSSYTHFHLSDHGKIYGAIEGGNILFFDPGVFLGDTVTEEPALRDFRVFDTTYAFDKAPGEVPYIKLSHRQNFISFHFASPEYDFPELINYAYQLKGLNADWVNCGTDRKAVFTDVRGGTFDFFVKAQSPEGNWSEPVLLATVSVGIPFWRSQLFYLGLILVLAGLLYALYRYRVNQIEKEAALRNEFNQQLAQTEMTALRAQMNPHFLFNCLNSIDNFILSNRPQEASNYLTKFSRLIRIILNHSKAEMVTLDKELEALSLYMEMESLRFSKKFSFNIKADEKVEGHLIEIPPMLIQPYVENAIWHGLMHKDSAGEIEIRLHMEDEYLQCEIWDNGIGREKSSEIKQGMLTKRKSFGMQITSDRMEAANKLYGKNGHAKVVDRHDPEGNATGTSVFLKIPVS